MRSDPAHADAGYEGEGEEGRENSERFERMIIVHPKLKKRESGVPRLSFSAVNALSELR